MWRGESLYARINDIRPILTPALFMVTDPRVHQGIFELHTQNFNRKNTKCRIILQMIQIWMSSVFSFPHMPGELGPYVTRPLANIIIKLHYIWVSIVIHPTSDDEWIFYLIYGIYISMVRPLFTEKSSKKLFVKIPVPSPPTLQVGQRLTSSFKGYFSPYFSSVSPYTLHSIIS